MDQDSPVIGLLLAAAEAGTEADMTDIQKARKETRAGDVLQRMRSDIINCELKSPREAALRGAARAL